ncbi:hypothetical protein GOP47_0008327 [Adiantum capillus-veneris]|uniref:Cyclin n=1 Tax=Adiantum capillus-veneris TaxID=13818 RepID=A0A9D4UYU8_ADICA|nr:hypothetical protein GOP47_0008327 [Adiantum capillus-veneris]
MRASAKLDSEMSEDSPRVLMVLSSLLQKMVTENDKHASVLDADAATSSTLATHATTMMQRLTVFHGHRAPSISVEQYVERIFKYANCSPSCFVVAYAYLDRFIHQQPGIPITSLNVHRLLITSVMVAAKFLDDSYYNNAYYGKVGGGEHARDEPVGAGVPLQARLPPARHPPSLR